ncbi:MAG: AAA family ATPase [Planctomycetota bacterium]|jgi:chromosome partitioning protein
MRKIAVINQKGGVGKTTTAVNLAAGIAACGHRVCLLDLDPQAHATLHLGVTLREGEPSVYDVLCNEMQISDVRRDVTEKLSVIPSHLDLAAAEMELACEVGREVILRDRLEQVTEPFDFLILDCPPSLGVLTLNALTAVDEVYLPMQPHFLALHGLSKLLRTIEIVSKRLNPALRLEGIVLCMYESGTRLAAEVSNDIEEFLKASAAQSPVWASAKFFQTKIRRNIRLAEAPSFGQSIFDYAPTSNGAEDYMALAREILNASNSTLCSDLPSLPLTHSASIAMSTP